MARWKARCELSRMGRGREGERAVRRQKLVEGLRCCERLFRCEEAFHRYARMASHVSPQFTAVSSELERNRCGRKESHAKHKIVSP